MKKRLKKLMKDWFIWIPVSAGIINGIYWTTWFYWTLVIPAAQQGDLPPIILIILFTIVGLIGGFGAGWFVVGLITVLLKLIIIDPAKKLFKKIK